MKSVNQCFRAKHGFLLSLAFFVICLILSIADMNRSFIFGIVVGITVLIVMQLKDKINAKVLIFAYILLFLVLAGLSLCVKTDSSLGRLLIYRVSLKMFTDNWLFGLGAGNFKIKYGLYQAAYFTTGNYSDKEFLLADNTYFAFNDYWQFVIEHGVLGVLFVLVTVLIVTKITVVALVMQPNNVITKLATSILIAIAIAAFFTHIFEQPLFLSIVIILVLYLLSVAVKGNLSVKALLVITFCIFVATFGICNLNYMANYRSYTRLKQAKLLISSGYISEGLSTYKAIFPYLKDDVAFLEVYADELKVNGAKMEALSLLIYTSEKRTSNRLYNDMGSLYFQMHRFRQAEKAYIISVNMVPNRFVTRNELLEFYLKTNDIPKARIEANKILYMPIKINSITVHNIRQRARSILQESL